MHGSRVMHPIQTKARRKRKRVVTAAVWWCTRVGLWCTRRAKIEEKSERKRARGREIKP